MATEIKYNVVKEIAVLSEKSNGWSKQLGLPSPVQFAEISVPAGAIPGGDPDIILHQGSWTVEIRNSVDPMLLCRILEAVGGHV